MSQKLLRLPNGGVLTMSADAADKLIEGADGRAALVYIYALKNSADFTAAEAAAALKMTEGEVKAAVASLRAMGLVESPDPVVERPDPAAVDPKFKMLVGETQRKLGKTLSTGELTILSGLYADLMLPPEVISILISHCIDRTRARTEDKRLPTLRQIEKEGYAWSETGIVTLEAATEHLRKYAEARESSSEVKKRLGLGGRILSDTEQAYVEGWLNMGFGPEEISEAYDRTVVNTGALRWPYLNKILCSWHEQGLHNLKDIKEKDRPASASGESRAKAANGGQNGGGRGGNSRGGAGEHEKDAVLRLQMMKKAREKGE